MSIINIFNPKVRSEIKRTKFRKLPNYVITSDFIKIFPDVEIRDSIYDMYFGYNENKKDFEILLSIAKLDIDFVNKMVKENIFASQNILTNIKILKKYGLDYKYINNDLEKVEEYITKYGTIIIPYLNDNYNLTINILKLYDRLLNNSDLKYVLENSEAINQIFSELKEKLGITTTSELLIPCINNKNIKELEKIKSLIVEGFSVDIIDLFKYYNYDEQTIELFKSKRIFDSNQIVNVDISHDDKISNIIIDYNISKGVKENNIDYIKNNIIYKYFGVTLPLDVINKYIMEKGSLSEEQLNFMSSAYEFVNNIKKSKTIEELKSICKNYNYSRQDFVNNVYSSWKNNLSQIVFNTNKKNQTVVDGVRVLDGSDIKEFNMLVHVISDRKKSYSPNGELSLKLKDNPELWKHNNDGGSDNISCSLISEYDMFTFGYLKDVDVILGFDDLQNSTIINAGTIDQMTNMEGKGFVYENTSTSSSVDWYLPKKLIDSSFNNGFNAGFAYNEIAIGRNEFGKVKKPNYILCTTNFTNGYYSKPIDDVALKWAKHYDIPIVQLDGNVLYDNALKKFEKCIDELTKGNINIVIFTEMMKSIKTMYFTKGKIIDVLNIVDGIIGKKDMSEMQIEECINIINKFKYHIINEFPERYISTADKTGPIIEERKNGVEQKLELLNKMLSELNKTNISHDEEQRIMM